MNDSQHTGSPLPWGRWGEVCLVALLGVVMALRAVDTYSELSATYDEGYHIAEGLLVYQEGNFAIGAEQAPLAHWAIGWLPHRAGVEYRTVTHRSASGHVIRKLSHTVLEEQGDYWTTLTSARLATLLFLPILVFYSYHWARRLYGRAAGWAACVLVTFSPSLLGHAALATIDLAAAALMLAAVYHLADWVERPTRRGAVLAGLFSGAAMATKYSSVVFVPVVAAAFVLIAWRGVVQRRVVQRGVVERGAPAVQIRTRAAQSLLLMAAAVLTIWASFGFEARPLRDPSRRPYEALDRLVPAGSALSSPAHWVAENVPVPLQDFAAGIGWVTEVDELDHPGFLFAQVRREGWWYYFPAVFAVKTT